MNINIRELSLDDYEDYIKLINQLRPIGYDISKEKYINLFNTIFQNNKIFVATIDNNIIGSITLIIEQKFIHNCSIYTRIEDLIVDNNYRNNKIGKQLVKHAIDYSKELNAFKITLTCKKNLQSFYEKNNFEEYDIHMSQLL